MSPTTCATSLLLIPEVAKVEIYGAQEERVFVEYSNSRLAELGLSPYQLNDILQSRNIINPGGDIRTPTRRSSSSLRATSSRWRT